jgi:GNAT superfamily N-acetyltransferase
MYRIVIARTAADLKAVVRMDRKCFPDDDPINIDDAIYFLALDDKGAPVGFGGIVLVSKGWFLRRAGVIKKARGEGLQKRLIQSRVRLALRYRPDYPIVTYTAVDNVPSQRSLVDCGFKPFNPREPYVGLGVIYWKYAKEGK